MRHWLANGLKRHIVSDFKVSRDPHFAEKPEDIVALYMSPPEHALVLRRLPSEGNLTVNLISFFSAVHRQPQPPTPDSSVALQT